MARNAMVARAMVARAMVARAMVARAMVAVAPARRHRAGRDTCPACYGGGGKGIHTHMHLLACYYLLATTSLLAGRRGAIGPPPRAIYVYLRARLPLPPLPPVVTLP